MKDLAVEQTETRYLYQLLVTLVRARTPDSWDWRPEKIKLLTVGIALQWNRYKYRIRLFLADRNTKWFIAVNDLVVGLLDCEWIYDPCRIGAEALEPKQDLKAKSMRNEDKVQ